MSLTTYRKKRNFRETPEPKQAGRFKGTVPRFVVQRHNASHLHYDFRLEIDGVLKSWAVPKGPSMIAGEKRLAVQVEDHPLAYGEFYGEIPEGNYGAGTVDLWDNGTYLPMEKITAAHREKTLKEQLKKGDLKITLKGKHLKGAFALVRMNDSSEGKNWLLIKKADEHAVKKYRISDVDPVKKHNGNIWHPEKTTKKTAGAKKKSTTQAGANKLPAATWNRLKKPMLASLSSEVINREGWIYETKFDGYRAITRINAGKVEMVSRNGHAFNTLYAPLIDELSQVTDQVILDGEVVINDQAGVSNFQLLQNYAATGKGQLRYMVFDLLFLNGHDVTGLPLFQRKELLSSFFEKYTFPSVHLSAFTNQDGKQWYRKLAAKGQEGMMAKKADSSYKPGKRTENWLKVKGHKMQEAVICGYTLPQKSRKYFGSLILGMYEADQLIYIGNCGTGFTDASLKELHQRFKKLERVHAPFPEQVRLTGAKGKPVWLKPELVCNVKFQEWTEDKHMRIPVFMGLRTDKEPGDVVQEFEVDKTKRKPRQLRTSVASGGKEPDAREIKVGTHRVKITNPGKEYWPGEHITKADLVHYYQRISKYLLPYLKNRPQSLNRHPNGIKASGFFQKDMDVKQLPAWAKTARMYSRSNRRYIDYLLCNEAATLVYMANLGCIEINPWHSKVNKPDHPDYLILDLDPGKIPFKEVVRTALVIKEICDELEIPCFCKTSGATGLHVYIPLKAKYTYDDVKTLAELLAILAHNRLPKTTSVERSVAKRTRKVYIDFLQNRKGQTIASAYSVRPREGATVSAPLQWKEVNETLDPQKFTLFNMESRLARKGDLWKGVLGKGINLTRVLKKLEKLQEENA